MKEEEYRRKKFCTHKKTQAKLLFIILFCIAQRHRMEYRWEARWSWREMRRKNCFCRWTNFHINSTFTSIQNWKSIFVLVLIFSEYGSTICIALLESGIYTSMSLLLNVCKVHRHLFRRHYDIIQCPAFPTVNCYKWFQEILIVLECENPCWNEFSWFQ